MLTELGLLAAGLAALPLVKEALRESPAKRRHGSEAGFASVLSGVTRYDWHGPASGPVTVCIHGLTTPSFVWQPLLPLLTMMGHRVLTYDLPGRGLSDSLPGQQDAAFFCNHLSALLADQGVTGPIRLVGYSMGGAIATAFASQNRDRCHSLTLIAPAGMGHKLGRTARFAAQTPLLGDWIFYMAYPAIHRRETLTAEGSPALPNLQDALIAELKRKGYLGSVLSSLRGALNQSLEAEHRAIARAGIPVTAIWGDQDVVIPLACKDVLRSWNPDARQAVIYGAGHGVAYTHPESILAAMR